MRNISRYDQVIAGFVSGLILPLLVGVIIYLFSTDGMSVAEYLKQISRSNIITHSISLCVFPNVLIFLLFNRLDMLKAAQGVLAVTIIWALIVFAVKLF